MSRRVSGLMVPLFSLRSSDSWGVGEFRDLPRFAEWAREAGQSFVQILPITEVPAPETSPYSALTAMALDPIFIALPAVAEFAALGGEPGLPPDERTVLAQVRAAGHVRYGEVRRLKDASLRRAYRRFAEVEAGGGSDRFRAFEAFARDHAEWLDDYALFQALREEHRRQPWWQWPAPFARREPGALHEAANRHRDEIDYRRYVQWIASAQWADARRAASPLRIFGDVPFMISADSPDVWTRQDEFRFDATVGVPPDAFSETGQDWGLPPWRWDVMAATDFAWMRRRARRTAELFDGFRLDHLVGLYRTYIRPLDANVDPFFAPPDEPSQIALGETLVGIYQATGAEVIAEDLGTVPDVVRESLRRLRVPGFKVMRWERRWSVPDTPYVDPADYHRVSVATTGTHDTEPLVHWWNALSEQERAEVLALPSMRRHSGEQSAIDAMIRGLLDGGSQLAILPLQDVFAWDERINTPAVVNEENWSWVLRWPVDQLQQIPESRARAAWLAHATRSARRGAGAPK